MSFSDFLLPFLVGLLALPLIAMVIAGFFGWLRLSTKQTFISQLTLAL
jgi:hypothetical protein